MVSNRIPLRTTLQLTYNCNLKCLHCYQTPIKNHNAVELSVKEWMQILKTLKLNGCLFLSMTGGEILVKQDFSDIYKAAYDMGYKITLSTNGSLLNDDHLALLKENKPIAVFVTLYGSSNSSYHHFCRTDIPSKAILNNIAKLKQRGVDTRIKVIANKIIKDEIAVIRQFSKYHEMPFNIYGKINCYIDGNSYPKSLQLSPKELLSVLTNEEIEALRESYTSPFAKWEKGIKQCSAGVTNAIIDPYGYMILCNELDKRRYSILEHGFTNCWRMVGNLRKILIEVKTYCSTCDYKEECGLCAPLFLNEYGNLNTTPMTSCKYSEEMRHLLKDWGK